MAKNRERTICWFSCGAASTVMTKMVLKDEPDALVVYCDTGSEHPDNKRFLAECEGWFGKEITILKSDKYDGIFDVFTTHRYICGPYFAKCTEKLKKEPRLRFQLDSDIQCFGYTVEEMKRAEQFNRSFPDVDAWYPLVEAELTKEQCIGLLTREGIEVPTMYKLGYNNNNCIGCVKGGMGYWNKIREDFPDVFKRMAKLERDLGNTCIRKDIKCPDCWGKEEKCDKCGKNRKVSIPQYLDELDPKAGRHTDIIIQCDFMCSMSEVFE